MRTWIQKSLPCILGNWHCGKHGFEIVYRKHLHFLGGAYHSMYPNSAILKKPRLGVLAHYFVFLFYAYRGIKDPLERALSSPSLTASQRAHLLEIQQFFKFYLIVVRYYLFSFHLGSLD